MSALRPELARIVDSLVRRAPEGSAVALDELGEALGVLSVTSAEIDLMIAAIEAQGGRVEAVEGGRGEAHLAQALGAARGLRATLGRAPRVEEIAVAAGLSEAQVRHALSLARIMQR